MSSLRSTAQLLRSRYFLGIGTGATETGLYLSDASMNAVQYTPGSAPSDFTLDVIVDPSTNPALLPMNVVQGQLYVDTGRQFIVRDSTNSYDVAIYREVQIVAGPGAFGVGGDATNGYNTIWAKVWSDSGQGILVVRTG